MPAIIIPKGHFIVMKTGTHPMRTRLRLFLEWGITFGDPYSIPEKTARPVAYASKQELELAIMRRGAGIQQGGCQTGAAGRSLSRPSRPGAT